MDYTVLQDYEPHAWNQGDRVGISDAWKKEASKLVKQGIIQPIPPQS